MSLYNKITQFFSLDAILDSEYWIIQQCDICFSDYQENPELLTKERLKEGLRYLIRDSMESGILFNSILVIFLLDRGIPIPEKISQRLADLIDEKVQEEQPNMTSERRELMKKEFIILKRKIGIKELKQVDLLGKSINEKDKK